MKIEDMVDLAMKYGIVQQAGAWYSIINTETGELVEKFQGMQRLVDFLKENEDKLNYISKSIENLQNNA